MASSRTQHEHKNPTSMAIPQLLTPEEPLLYSFTAQDKPRVPVQTQSPPASPETQPFATIEAGAYSPQDSVLYADNINDRTSSADKPLFESGTTLSRHDTPESDSVATPSQRESPEFYEHNTATTFVGSYRLHSSSSGVGEVAQYNADPLGYWGQMVEQLEGVRRMQKAGMANRQLPPPAATSRNHTRDPYTAQVLASFRSSRVEKAQASTSPAMTRPKIARASPAKPVRSSVSSAVVKRESQHKRNRRSRSTPDAAGLSQSAQPKPRTRAPPSKIVDDKDKDWRLIADFAPPVSSLDDMNVRLRATWNNGNQLDLTNDPDREHLHPQEVETASVLRLSCRHYLANKRRIFIARLDALKQGREFNKTSAQSCTMIDVNKASRLWEAFNNVGWFHEKWFEQHLSA